MFDGIERRDWICLKSFINLLKLVEHFYKNQITRAYTVSVSAILYRLRRKEKLIIRKILEIILDALINLSTDRISCGIAPREFLRSFDGTSNLLKYKLTAIRRLCRLTLRAAVAITVFHRCHS